MSVDEKALTYCERAGFTEATASRAQAFYAFVAGFKKAQAEIDRLRGATQPMYDEFAKSAAPVNPMAALHEMWLTDQRVTFDADLVRDLFSALAEGNGQEGGV